MAKLFGRCLLIAFIVGAAVWGAQHIGFFPRISSAFQSLIGGSADAASNHEKPAGADAQRSHDHPQNSGEEGGANGHQMPPLSESWKNVGAFFALFACMVMLSYYGEQGMSAWVGRRN